MKTRSSSWWQTWKTWWMQNSERNSNSLTNPCFFEQMGSNFQRKRATLHLDVPHARMSEGKESIDNEYINKLLLVRSSLPILITDKNILKIYVLHISSFLSHKLLCQIGFWSQMRLAAYISYHRSAPNFRRFSFCWLAKKVFRNFHVHRLKLWADGLMPRHKIAARMLSANTSESLARIPPSASNPLAPYILGYKAVRVHQLRSFVKENSD